MSLVFYKCGHYVGRYSIPKPLKIFYDHYYAWLMFLAKMLEGHSDLKMYYAINVFGLSIWRAQLFANVIQDGCFSTKSVGKTTFFVFCKCVVNFFCSISFFHFLGGCKKNSSRIWKWRNEIERGRLEKMFWVNERSDTFMSSSSTLESVRA